jgi:tetratricopeptide (TPR) repeat protein
MSSTSKLFLYALTFLFLATSAYAQSPREQLQLLVEQLRANPNDNALRGRIIKQAQEITPAPAIPEEAREPFIMGTTVLKKASGPAGASKAVELFTQALTVAPWFADAYYNRSLAHETAGQFESAIDDLKLYLAFTLTDAERREAQDKIYSLKADAQLDATKKAEQSKIARAEEDKRQAQQAKRDVITQIKNAVGSRSYKSSTLSYSDQGEKVWGGVTQHELLSGKYYLYIFWFFSSPSG